MNPAFADSLRIGEIPGLTGDNMHISDEEIAVDNAYVYINKEQARGFKRAIDRIGEKDSYDTFAPAGISHCEAIFHTRSVFHKSRKDLCH